MSIPPQLVDYILKSGKWVFVLVIVILSLNHWNFINISSTAMLDIMWGYLVLNSFGVAAIIYRRYSLKSSKDVCPYCKGELQQKITYTCPECGELKPEK